MSGKFLEPGYVNHPLVRKHDRSLHKIKINDKTTVMFWRKTISSLQLMRRYLILLFSISIFVLWFPPPSSSMHEGMGYCSYSFSTILNFTVISLINLMCYRLQLTVVFGCKTKIMRTGRTSDVGVHVNWVLMGKMESWKLGLHTRDTAWL